MTNIELSELIKLLSDEDKRSVINLNPCKYYGYGEEYYLEDHCFASISQYFIKIPESLSKISDELGNNIMIIKQPKTYSK